MSEGEQTDIEFWEEQEPEDNSFFEENLIYILIALVVGLYVLVIPLTVNNFEQEMDIGELKAAVEYLKEK